MIVDLLRNDLSRIAQTGSVEVEKLFQVETYPTVHQLVSTITARKRKDVRMTDMIRALFPCGSVTGAPKIRAMEVIRDLEQSPRGVYCGAIGSFSPDGSASFNVAIRTLTISGYRGELGIGGGVVYDSTSAGEYEEALLKARYFEAARKPLQLIETLRWSPAEGLCAPRTASCPHGEVGCRTSALRSTCFSVRQPYAGGGRLAGASAPMRVRGNAVRHRRGRRDGGPARDSECSTLDVSDFIRTG